MMIKENTNKYYEKMVLKDEIEDIIDKKMMKFIHCESHTKIFQGSKS